MSPISKRFGWYDWWPLDGWNDRWYLLRCRQLMKISLVLTCTLLPQAGTIAHDTFAPSSDRETFRSAALILARGGSKGIKKKNLSVVNGKTLIKRAVENILESDVFDSVWVSTDDMEIAMEAQKATALLHWRHPSTATDSAASILGVQDFFAKHPDLEVIGLIQCTSPFLTSQFLIKALRLIEEAHCDSVFSVTRSHQLRWNLDQRGDLHAANFDATKRPRRQDWNGEFVENGMFYVFKTSLLAENVLQGGRARVVEIPKNRSLEIDTEFDLVVAKVVAQILDSESQQMIP
nr:PREDICTED: N-acylneuraminate cytidylyltransferase [Bemisia tabaci]XP_018904121.1 PREDICTED: N-acylneuraminate cytidylyltransferase [Bemisia tabaci]